ncbi:hypothetical protein [Streptomyces sulphureus]|uniref:hypothetical protein n=1 Tax=Streptomyces sulphureus TaxID=47758 RepID=UPI00038063EC|nr:hypothetical protein [Streptomyces sulphureus]
MNSPTADCGARGRDRRHLGALLLVEPEWAAVRAAAAAGFEVLVLVGPEREEPPYGPESGPGGPLLRADLRDPEAVRALVSATTRTQRIAGLVAFGSAGELPAVLETAEALSLSANPAASARLLGDPIERRRLLNRGSGGYVAYALADTDDELGAAVREMGPRATVRHVERSPRAGPEGGGVYFVEEALDGPRLGVETVTVDGMHHVLGVASLHHACASVSGHLLPAPLGREEEAQTRAAVTGLLDLAGYECGPAYTVVALTADGPRVVGASARRASGPVAGLLAPATGLDRDAEFFGLLAGGSLRQPVAGRHALAAPLRPPAGWLLSVEGIEEIAALPGVCELSFPYLPGDRVPEGEDGTDRWPGYVVVAADSPGEAAHLVTAVRRLFRARVAESGRPPAGGGRAVVRGPHRTFPPGSRFGGGEG